MTWMRMFFACAALAVLLQPACQEFEIPDTPTGPVGPEMYREYLDEPYRYCPREPDVNLTPYEREHWNLDDRGCWLRLREHRFDGVDDDGDGLVDCDDPDMNDSFWDGTYSLPEEIAHFLDQEMQTAWQMVIGPSHTDAGGYQTIGEIPITSNLPIDFHYQALYDWRFPPRAYEPSLEGTTSERQQMEVSIPFCLPDGHLVLQLDGRDLRDNHFVVVQVHNLRYSALIDMTVDGEPIDRPFGSSEHAWYETVEVPVGEVVELVLTPRRP